MLFEREDGTTAGLRLLEAFYVVASTNDRLEVEDGEFETFVSDIEIGEEIFISPHHWTRIE